MQALNINIWNQIFQGAGKIKSVDKEGQTLKYVECDINAGNFIDSYRNIGYSIETAITDVIDNSIFAKATTIYVDMIWDPYESKEPFVRISDNGVGMTDDELHEAMRLACRSPLDVRDSKDLGRFGLGLKSASFSQCRRFTVISRKGGNIACKQWDIDQIKKEGFKLIDCNPSEVGLDDSVPKASGTVVVWQNLDHLNIPEELEPEKKDKLWMEILKKVHTHLQITYGDFKNKIAFIFNGNPVELWSPFSIEGVNITTDEEIPFGESVVRVRTYILPKTMTAEETTKASLGKSMNEMQGFYIYRNKRLIKYGGWLDLQKMENKEAFRLARIRLDIDNSMDDAWHIDVKKENAVCPPALIEKLTSYAKQARADSRKIFRSKGRTLRRKSEDNKSIFLWSYGTKDGKAFYEINRLNPLIKAFNEDLDDDQQKDFQLLLKAIENHIPVMSILETESSSNGNYVENHPSTEINDHEIAEKFRSLIESCIRHDGLTLEEAIDFISGTEPFINHVEIIDNIVKEIKEGQQK